MSKRYTLKETIQAEIESLNNKATICKSKLDESFIYNFEWGYAGDLYVLMFEKARMEKYLELILESPDKAEEILERQIRMMQDEILKGDFLGASTSIFANLTHTYKKEVKCTLIKTLETYLSFITQDNPMPIID